MSHAPHITLIDPNSPEFRMALAKAGAILVEKSPFWSVYSAHTHWKFEEGQIVFEEEVAPGRLMLYPEYHEVARAKGKPSCWSFTEDGSVVVMRYASMSLHARSGIDVTSDAFQVELAEIGRAFATAGLHSTLELNIAGKLFPVGEGQITHEVTNEEMRQQRVTLTSMPAAIITGDWGLAACWSFNTAGEPLVTGMCNRGGGTTLH